jgi:hypothetical protein
MQTSDDGCNGGDDGGRTQRCRQRSVRALLRARFWVRLWLCCRPFLELQPEFHGASVGGGGGGGGSGDGGAWSGGGGGCPITGFCHVPAFFVLLALFRFRCNIHPIAGVKRLVV